jgi:hypothetical protein
MRSPFRSEAHAFRLVPVVAAAAAAGTVASVWAPTAVAAAVSALALAAVAAVYLVGGRRPSSIPAAPPHVGPEAERRLLLVVSEPLDEDSLAGLRGRSDRVLVLSPAATSPLRHWISDVDRAREQASDRMTIAVARLRDLQIEAVGVVGDDDTFAAVDDALRTFGGDEIAVAGGDEALVEGLRARYAMPVARVGAA